MVFGPSGKRFFLSTLSNSLEGPSPVFFFDEFPQLDDGSFWGVALFCFSSFFVVIFSRPFTPPFFSTISCPLPRLDLDMIFFSPPRFLPARVLITLLAPRPPPQAPILSHFDVSGPIRLLAVCVPLKTQWTSSKVFPLHPALPNPFSLRIPCTLLPKLPQRDGPKSGVFPPGGSLLVRRPSLPSLLLPQLSKIGRTRCHSLLCLTVIG